MTASVITSFTGIIIPVGYEGEVTVNGENFTDGGVPSAYINDEVVAINSYTNNYVKFNMPNTLDYDVHTLTVLNGDGE